MARAISKASYGNDERAILRKASLRVTRQRIEVLARLRAADSPISHPELAEILAAEGIDRAVVYRVLMDLVAAGLVERAAHGHIWRFELLRESSKRSGQHPHFTCTVCGSVSCLDDLDPSIASAALPRGAKLEALELRGHCVDCR